jgi:ring-1,2-phenylacetyl-CoA epoxidase subunit PaaC
MQQLVQYIYSIADNCLILGQRLGEMCGHGPSLETDIALTNISLDLLGQTRSYYQYAAQYLGAPATEDTIAFTRTEREYKNVLLAEQPNTDFAYVTARHFYFDVFHLLFLEKLQQSSNPALAAIANKAVKEVSYHRRFSSDWVKRLGDGTAESRQRMQMAIDDLFIFTDELFHETDADIEMIKSGVGVSLNELRAPYYQAVRDILAEATLTMPESPYFRSGGKKGIHSEHMGYILADLQYMQRTFPNMKW